MIGQTASLFMNDFKYCLYYTSITDHEGNPVTFSDTIGFIGYELVDMSATRDFVILIFKENHESPFEYKLMSYRTSAYQGVPNSPIINTGSGSPYWGPIKMTANQDCYFVLFKQDPRNLVVSNVMNS